MERRVMLAFAIIIAAGLLLIVGTISSRNIAEASANPSTPIIAEASASPPKMIFCPIKLNSSYGDIDGWSTAGATATVFKAEVTKGYQTLICRYGYEGKTVVPVFAITKPCPDGYSCEVWGNSNGFQLTPLASRKK